MGIPFDITKYEEEKIESDMKRFQELFSKYKDANISEILEFAKLYERFVGDRHNKYI